MDTNLKQLQRLAETLDNYLVEPNRGGCCVVAVEIARYLRTIYPTSIRVATDFTENAEINVTDVANEVLDHDDVWEWNDLGVYFGHVVVEFEYQGEQYHIDTNGVQLANHCDPTFGWVLHDGDLPFDSAELLANRPKGWNTRFNRKQIPKLRMLVSNFFKQAQLT